MPIGNNIVDIEELMKNWAKKWFDKNERHQVEKKYGKIPFDKMNIAINQSKFSIEHETPLYEKETALGSFAPRTHVLFKSTFSNTTSQAQTFNMHTERRTISSVNVNVTEGFCFGQEFSLTVGLPQIDAVEASIGLYREVNFEKSANVNKEQEVTWAVDSQIVVPAQTTSVAELAIKEDEYNSKFNVKSFFRGKFYVDFIKDNVELARAVGSNLKEIFTSDDGFKVDTETGDVYFETHGVCTCRFGIDQEVKITETKNKVD
ncbi:uncharacterized protein LOC141907088 [Tubulanus polymorphus]|uniref:uncharacterized protein LOC141907088 n=1 Tax=Tubulanus polymorphus TaxID=672921 RepID=UPI003DA3DE9C